MYWDALVLDLKGRSDEKRLSESRVGRGAYSAASGI